MKRGVFCRLRPGNGWIEPRADLGEATPVLSNLTAMTRYNSLLPPMLVQKELGGHISHNRHKLKSLPRAWRELQHYATRWVGGLALFYIPQAPQAP